MFKNLGRCLFGLSMIVLFSGIQCFALPWWNFDDKNPYEFPYENYDINNEPTTDLPNITVIQDDDSIINRLLDVFWLGDIQWEHKFIAYVRGILNIALWLLSMIALIMTIYTFYMMFFTENEAWAKKAKWNLIGIFIALGIIWLSWLIVSFIFRWYQSQWQNALN